MEREVSTSSANFDPPSPRDALDRGPDAMKAQSLRGADDPRTKRRSYEAPLSIARRMRVAARFGLLSTGTLAIAVAWFAVLPFVARSPRRRRAWRGAMFRAWAQWVLARLHVELVVRGNAPAPPCLLVSNHTGYVDVLVLAAAVRDPVFVSNADVRRYPFFGPMARSFGTVFIERERKRDLPATDREMSSYLAAGHTVVLFPEGTSSRGDAVHPFRSSLFAAAAREGRPVAYAVLAYHTDPPDPPPSHAVCWVATPMLTHAVQLLALDGVRAEIEFGNELVRAENRKELAALLRSKVASRFTPLE